MKTAFFASAMVIIVSVGFTSCRKCEICTKNSEPEIRICEGDYNSNTEYGLALDGLELLEYSCR